MWPEVETTEKENKRELKLSGAAISERLGPQNSQLDRHIFELTAINLLNISDTTLTVLPEQISNLTNLQTLLLYGNQLERLPAALGALDKLKVLDVSRNQLKSVPAEIAKLTQLATVNLSNNQLEQFPTLTQCSRLSVLDVSNNRLLAFPDVCLEANSNLSEVHAKCNQIAVIPQQIVQLPALKHLGLASNRILVVPKVLAGMPKLKELLLEDNPITDKRLYKLILQCRTKQILDYVKQHGAAAPKEDPLAAKPASSDASADADAAAAPSAGGGKNKKDAATVAAHLHRILVQRHTDATLRIVYTDAVREVRPHILCCIVRNLSLADPAAFKRFLQIQTRLHDTVCGNREKSTIATHDLLKVRGGVVRYTAKPPNRLQIVPLGKAKLVSGERLYNKLKSEAEALRKEKKRNVYSGIHKYLYLLERLPVFACLEDGEGTVISLPPLTNADATKISPETTDVFVEVTSSTSMADCRAAIEDFLVEMLLAGFGTATASAAIDAAGDAAAVEKARNFEQELIVQQVKSTDVEGNLRAVFPGKTDLLLDEKRPTILVERE